MNLMLNQIGTRLVLAAMKPYKPKTNAQKKLKNDLEHRKAREAYKFRSTSDKLKDQKYRKDYYRKNKAQILMRNKKSRMLHKAEVMVLSKYGKLVLSGLDADQVELLQQALDEEAGMSGVAIVNPSTDPAVWTPDYGRPFR